MGVYRSLDSVNENVNILKYYLQLLSIYFQVSLILEYCSKGDLKTFLIENRKDIEKHLNEFYKTGSISHSEMKISKKPIDYYLDVSILYRWVFQVENITS